MPPHLHDGVPRQQRRLYVPPPQFFCTCSECDVHNYYEVRTHEVKHGQYLTGAQYQRHCRREKQRKVAWDNYHTRAQVGFDGPDKVGSTSPDLQARRSASMQPMKREGMDSKDTAIDNDRNSEGFRNDMDSAIDDWCSEGSHIERSVPRKARRRPTQSSEGVVSNQLRQLADSLSTITADGFWEGFQRNPAVFISPPGTQTEEPNLDLDPYAQSNYAFLRYEKSLQEASEFLSRAASRKLSRIDSLRCKRLEIQVAKEKMHALQLKQDLWEQQRSINQRTEPVVDSSMPKSV